MAMKKRYADKGVDVYIGSELVRDYKILAAQKGKFMREVMEDALRAGLAKAKAKGQYASQ